MNYLKHLKEKHSFVVYNLSRSTCEVSLTYVNTMRPTKCHAVDMFEFEYASGSYVGYKTCERVRLISIMKPQMAQPCLH